MSEKILSKTNNSKFLSAPHIPYKGNRAAIAQQLCEAMPPCNHFLDACCGGASVGLTMLAMGKCRELTLNDIYKPTIVLLEALISGHHDIDFEHPQAVTRQQFFDSIERINNNHYTPNDVATQFCYSFGNNGKSYLYGKDIEDLKCIAQNMIADKTLYNRRMYYGIEKLYKSPTNTKT